jgi:MATE family multidrug resistance protein
MASLATDELARDVAARSAALESTPPVAVAPTREARELLKLAGPLALAFAGNQLLGVVDTAMVGRLGATQLAGVALGNGLFFAVTVMGIGAVQGMDPLVSQAIGAGEGARARAVLTAGLRLSVGVGLALAVVAGLVPLLLPTFGVDAATSREALRFVLGRLPALIPFLWVVAMRSYLQSRDFSRPIVTSMIVSNLVNFAANGLLIFGDDALLRVGLPAMGLPALGVLGSGLASSIASIAQLAIVWRSLLVLRPAAGGGDTAIGARDILRIGWPIALTFLAEVGAFTVVGVLAGRIGPHAASGHQVAITIASVTFCVSMGIASATTVRVGRAVGRGDSAGARRAGFVGLAASLVYMATCAVGLAILASPVARLLSDRPEVLASAIPLVVIASFFQLSDGIQVTAAGALRGIGDTRFIQWTNVFGHYVVGLPLAIALAFGAGLAERGLWWGLSAGLTAVAIPLVWRFHTKSRGPLARVA